MPTSDTSIHQSALTDFFTTNKRMPSVREIAKLLGFNSPNAAQRVIKKLLVEKFIEKDSTGRLIPGKTWPLSDDTSSQKITIPLLGTVQAGFPTGAEESSDTVTLDDWIIGRRANCFMLRVSGDSMVDAGILPGDMVIIERGKSPKNGNIVVAEVDHDWTLKYYQNAHGRVTLFPANKAYPPITAHDELRIAGIVNAVIRKYA
jgi:SOS regulatory protein LexA